LKQDGTPKMPFDMSQYDNLIGTTRIPRRGQDEIIYGHQRKSSHIYLTRNGHVSFLNFYHFKRNCRNLSIFKTNLSILKTNLSIFKTNLSILKRNLSILKRNLSILKRNLSIFKRNLSIFKA
jgi:hypothetical protein